jgi:hypothetical protein
MDFIGERVHAFQWEGVGRPKSCDLSSSQGTRSGVFCIADSIAFQKPSIDWNVVRLRVQRAEYSLSGQRRRRP